MSLNRRTFVQATAALAASAGATRVFAADTLKIGYVSPQTGPLAPFGEADKWVIEQMKSAFKDGLTIGGKKVTEVIADEAWLKGDFISRVQKRGAEVINARGKSSAASAANAAIDHVYSWATGSVPGDYTSMAVVSDGSYGIPEGLVFSYPVKITAPWKYEIVQGQQLNEHTQAAIKVTTDELLGERDAVKEMIGG